jgi:DNA helicase IV
MSSDSDLAAEQAHLDRAYDALEASRRSASRLAGMVEVGRGGTNQARYEREVIHDSIVNRLTQLHIGDASLIFGRIDRDEDSGGEVFHIGRVAVSDEDYEPLVIDWRAPVAEPFYRATGREPMGLYRRRHFATRGRKLLAMEDEVFDGEALLSEGAGSDLVGKAALLASLEEARTGRLGDIVATIQAEQDAIIRSELPGVLVVQGGPGTGKTVVALHRAAYLLYTHRFPLEGQGVLVVGPNRLFLGYIEHVLPSLGEVGVELAVTSDLVSGAKVEGRDTPEVARIKGDARMGMVISRAIDDRERPLRWDLVVPYGRSRLRMSRQQSAQIVRSARRRFRGHNAARRYVEQQVFQALAESTSRELEAGEVRAALRWTTEVREALEWMWPRLTPEHLLHDLFGSRALLRHAARGTFGEAAADSLHRPRSAHASEVRWTVDDVPLLDEAHAYLGPVRGREEIRTFGHIVVDEAQDRSPMELRMLARRSLSGSMTIVGDIGQATGPWGAESWEDVLEHLPDRRPPRHIELTVGYRIPASLMGPAVAVLSTSAPWLTPPTAVRPGEDPPEFVRVLDPAGLGAEVASAAVRARDHVEPGNVAVIVPRSLVDDVAAGLEAAGVEFGHATRRGLDRRVTLVPVDLAKGLELDAAVVVEPTAIVAEESAGLRSLYVALTRATRRLAVIHARALPDPMRISDSPPEAARQTG